MKNKLLIGGALILIIGIIFIAIGINVIVSNIHTTNTWHRVNDSLYISDEIKISEDTLLIVSHGGHHFGIINSKDFRTSYLENVSYEPIETTNNEAIYDLDNGSYLVWINSNYTPHATINYISINLLLVYGVITIGGLVLFIVGIILLPLAIISSRKIKK